MRCAASPCATTVTSCPPGTWGHPHRDPAPVCTALGRLNREDRMFYQDFTGSVSLDSDPGFGILHKLLNCSFVPPQFPHL